jgi:prepilin-type processing-associated H-X9-DG protein/prepilin-type N-terminal cleavage/methylation domain-containing protein
MKRESFPNIWTSKPSRERGFTLVEILVSLGVLAILAALVVPTMTRQLEKGRSAGCVAKLRKAAEVMARFRIERDQQMWNRTPVNEGGEGDLPPVRIFYRYALVANAKEFQCPSATTSAQGAWKTGGTGTAEYVANIAEPYVSYSVNDIAFYRNSPYMMSTSPLHNFLQFSGGESKTPIFLDGNHFQLNQNSWKPASRFDRLMLRHEGRCNVLFLDGHVESLDRAGAERLDPHGGTNPRWLQDFGPQ